MKLSKISALLLAGLMLAIIVGCDRTQTTTYIERDANGEITGTQEVTQQIHPQSYYVGNSMYGHWAITPYGREVWVMYPAYSSYGPTSVSGLVALGLTGAYYRSVWRSSYPGGWGSSGSYDTSRSTTINKTVINNYGGKEGLTKAVKSPEYQKKKKSYSSAGKGKPKTTPKMKSAFNSDKKKMKLKSPVSSKTASKTASKGLPKASKTVKPAQMKKVVKVSKPKYKSKKSYSWKPPVRKKSYTSSYKRSSFSSSRKRR